MDLELSADQQLLDDSLRNLFRDEAGPERARAHAGGVDDALVGLLDGHGYLDTFRDAGVIEAVLVAERASERVAAAPVVARVLVGPLAGFTDLPPRVGLVDLAGGGSGLVRYAGRCDAYLLLDGDDAALATADDVEVEPVPSRAGYPMGRVRVRRSSPHPAAGAGALRRAWQAGLAVETGSIALAAVEFAARHVSGREQFGRPIGSFQAVQHRLARAYAMAQATRWLGRRGAWHHGDEYRTAAAATFATLTAREAYDDVHQVVGAIGVTSEYGMTEWTTRLLALHAELGGRRSHARRVAATRRPGLR